MSKDWRIVVLPAGWVFVGNYTQNNEYSMLTNAYCIRKWGTTNGLGQLALTGPTKDTILDETGVVYFKTGTEVCSLACKTEWKIK